ncbi:MAG: hypothetical protein HC827_20490 [Cyanobacteria bacterium RM1_2_2]|nr:hypothetical protein [Cyanobacteria bacterium RM1_2_2]
MLSYPAIANQPGVFQSLASLKIEEFQQLLQPFEQAWVAYVQTHHIQGMSHNPLAKDGV